MTESKEQRTKRVHATRYITPANTLHNIGGYAIEKAESDEEGSFLELVTALLMCAFTLEAVLNHVGRHLFYSVDGDSALWDLVERANPLEKLSAIAEQLSLPVDYGSRPFQLLKPMFKFRNAVAHPKSDEVSAMLEVPDDITHIRISEARELKADWELQCDIDTAREWHQAVWDIAAILCVQADTINPLVTGYPGSWSF
ncbi:MAG: hypothetical protein Kow0067_16420 [Coriobacteriia bacterium]